MRKLSDTFINQLKTGFLSKIIEYVRNDPDINFEIRDNYFNLYFKGHFLLNLREKGSHIYLVRIHPKIKGDIDIPLILDCKMAVKKYIRSISNLKTNILSLGKQSLEMEYEQMIIRANNSEKRINSEYFILDRQFAIGGNRIDLMGFYWPSAGRRKNQVVDMCLMEVKFGLNTDIAEIHEQLSKYYKAIWSKASNIAQEGEIILKQKLKLGLFNQSTARNNAMKTLKISSDISNFQFIIFLIDFNPYSTIYKSEKINSLSFADQIRIVHSGFAL